MKKTNHSINENTELKDEQGKTIEINPEGEKDIRKEDLVDKKTLKKYQLHWYQKIPYPVRALFIKYWFFGLNYFLFNMGLGALPYFVELKQETFAINTLILLFIQSFALGAFNEVFVYNILDVIEDFPGESKRFIFFKSKKLYSLFINIFYGIVSGLTSLILCGVIATAIGNETWLFREPFTFALVAFFVDLVFVEGKNLIVRLLKKDHSYDEYEDSLKE